jgi:Arylsulfatase A and related enzymes
MNPHNLKRLMAIATGILLGVAILTSIVAIYPFNQDKNAASYNHKKYDIQSPIDDEDSSNSSGTRSDVNTFSVPSISPSSSGRPSTHNHNYQHLSPFPSTPPQTAPSFENPTARNVTTARKPPNILIILADDVGTGDIPFYWNSSKVNMPNLKYLAEQGVMFKNAHSSPLCAPSRYMLLSGNYAHRGVLTGGTWNFKGNHGNQFRSSQKSIAQVLRDEAGYHTAMFGKWHLGAKVPPNGVYNYSFALSDSKHNWSQALIDGPQDIGFDESFMTCGGIQAPPYSFFRNGFLTTKKRDVVYWDKFSQHDMPNGISMIGKHGGEGDLNWDSSAYNMILVNETARFIDDHMKKRPNDPFFAYVALGAVHIPHSPPNFYIDGSRVCNVYETRHLDLLLELDKVVGSLVSVIEQRQAANNTIIIFTSDNGGLTSSSDFFHNSSGPLRGRKGQIYEGGHRVPMIWRYDGLFPKNESRNHMVGLNDVYATLCEIVGIKVPYGGSAYDSISFSKYLASGNMTNDLREYLPTWSNKGSKGILHAIQHKSGLKLIHDTDTHELSLFNLSNDIAETVDNSKNPSFRQIMKLMYQKLLALGPCPNDVEYSFQLSMHTSISSGPAPYGNVVTMDVNCTWFMTDTISRCKRYSEGEILCNSICGRFKNECQNTIFKNQKYPLSLL